MTMRPPLAHGSEYLFSSLDNLRAGCLDLPPAEIDAAALAAERQSQLTKPPGSLGRLEDIVAWLARSQGRSMPRLDWVEILVFAGNHGVTKHGVSAYPVEVTAQVVANFSAGHAALLHDPLSSAAALGGRELAAILGAALAARHRRIPILLDGFVCVAAVAPLAKLRADALEHALAAHVSAEAGHRMLLTELRLDPLLDLGMRLGEGSGAAVAVSVLRAALACHSGMATFVEAGVADKPR